MKKLALSSLIAVFAVSGAHAANVIDGNPLYMPKANHFYSVTDVATHTEGVTPWGMQEDFGYGITDKLAVQVSTTLWENDSFDTFAWDNMSLSATFRALDMKGWKADLVAAYTAGADEIVGGGLYYHQKSLRPADDNFWFDKDLIGYRWTAGIRGGYVSPEFTIAGHIAYEYFNGESFNWGDYGEHSLKLGIDGQFVVDSNWNLVAGAEYTGITNDKVATYTDVKSGIDVKDAGVWTGYFGVNYNIDATKFVGAYVNGRMAHATGDWEMDDGFGFGFKFGVDF